MKIITFLLFALLVSTPAFAEEKHECRSYIEYDGLRRCLVSGNGSEEESPPDSLVPTDPNAQYLDPENIPASEDLPTKGTSPEDE